MVITDIAASLIFIILGVIFLILAFEGFNYGKVTISIRNKVLKWVLIVLAIILLIIGFVGTSQWIIRQTYTQKILEKTAVAIESPPPGITSTDLPQPTIARAEVSQPTITLKPSNTQTSTITASTIPPTYTTMPPSLPHTPTITKTYSPSSTFTLSPIAYTITSTTTPTLKSLSPGETRILPISGMVQVYIPAGVFYMGASVIDTSVQPLEDPSHTVFLDGYWIDQFYVTNEMYMKCIDSKACEYPDKNSAKGIANYFTDDKYIYYPVVNVNWFEAMQYCKWAGGTLPTEAEWEKAARGTDGRIFPWGNDYRIVFNNEVRANICDVHCNTKWGDNTIDDGYYGIAPVKNYPAGVSPYKVYDMAGNVWQWVSDWYNQDYYRTLPKNAENPMGPERGTRKIVKGGSLINEVIAVRSSYRYIYIPETSGELIGFRCAAAE